MKNIYYTVEGINLVLAYSPDKALHYSSEVLSESQFLLYAVKYS